MRSYKIYLSSSKGWCGCGENLLVTVQATPNLRVINMWGVSFVDDAHIEAFSSNCIQLAVLCVSYCPKVPHKQAFTP